MSGRRIPNRHARKSSPARLCFRQRKFKLDWLAVFSLRKIRCKHDLESDLPHPITIVLTECRAQLFEPVCIQSAALNPGDVPLQVLQAAGADDRA